MLKGIITFLFLAVAIVIGLPCAFFGVLGLTGRLADASFIENVKGGLMFLFFAAVIWGPTAVWLSWLWRPAGHELSFRFSMRSMMVAVTVIALAAGFLTALLAG